LKERKFKGKIIQTPEMKARTARRRELAKKQEAYNRRWTAFERGLAKLMSKHGVENYATIALLERDPGMSLLVGGGWHQVLKAKFENRNLMACMMLAAYKDIVLTGASTDGTDLETAI
jgi:hypothetical protein